MPRTFLEQIISSWDANGLPEPPTQWRHSHMSLAYQSRPVSWIGFSRVLIPPVVYLGCLYKYSSLVLTHCEVLPEFWSVLSVYALLTRFWLSGFLTLFWSLVSLLWFSSGLALPSFIVFLVFSTLACLLFFDSACPLCFDCLEFVVEPHCQSVKETQPWF